MTVEGAGVGAGGIREGLVLDPVRQGVNGCVLSYPALQGGLGW